MAGIKLGICLFNFIVQQIHVYSPPDSVKLLRFWSSLFGHVYRSDLVIFFWSNRGRIITYKLKQQVDVDELYEREFFEFERRMGQEVCVVACKIRGVRNPANRPAVTVRAAAPAPRGPPPVDDGTRLVRILGCEYRLSESEITNWLSCFGEVLSEDLKSHSKLRDLILHSHRLVMGYTL